VFQIGSADFREMLEYAFVKLHDVYFKPAFDLPYKCNILREGFKIKSIFVACGF
jgi:hypothetical protein